MEPPDPLLSFLVVLTPEPKSPRSASSAIAPHHQAPDPHSPPPDLRLDGSQSATHSSSIGLEDPEANQRPPASASQGAPQELNPIPASPTEVNHELQERAWALLPDLARDLSKLKDQRPCSDAEVCRGAFNPLPAHACNQPEDADACNNPKDTSVQAKDMDHQKQTDIEGHLLRSRIPANEKGKAVQGARSIHVDQATSRKLLL